MMGRFPGRVAVPDTSSFTPLKIEVEYGPVPPTVTRNGVVLFGRVVVCLYAVLSAVWIVTPLPEVTLKARLVVWDAPTLMTMPPGVNVATPAVTPERVVAVSVLMDNDGAEPLPT